ncbi:DNA topoisomerase IV [Flavobacterium rhizosphaerae]|uniref:DNA topoisomerase IV n=1 Tax=Flavobacterium rhizosphaerae TaxID=3163298 RepID=A0ABW8YV72_9FLAO
MKKVLYLFILTVLLMSCYNQERNCTNFKTGKFESEYIIDGEKKTTVFIRTDSLEIETYEGKTDTATVRWVNDCEYVLRKMNPKNMQEEKAVDMKILTTNGDTYTYEFSIVGDKQKLKGIATKIN